MANAGPQHPVPVAIRTVEADQITCCDRLREYTFGSDVVVNVNGIRDGQPVGQYQGVDLRYIFDSNGAKLLLRTAADGDFEVEKAEPAELSVLDARLLGLNGNGFH